MMRTLFMTEAQRAKLITEGYFVEPDWVYEEILNRIFSEASNGEDCAWFEFNELSEQNIARLEYEGFRVTEFEDGLAVDWGKYED